MDSRAGPSHPHAYVRGAQASGSQAPDPGMAGVGISWLPPRLRLFPSGVGSVRIDRLGLLRPEENPQPTILAGWTGASPARYFAEVAIVRPTRMFPPYLGPTAMVIHIR